jgi:hypothetical protein
MRTTILILCLIVLTLSAAAQTRPSLIAMGDSIGEGVQSADANFFSQPNSYLNLIARRMSARFPLPLIVSSPVGVVGSTIGRGRLLPSVEGLNLAVSGADVGSGLREAADTAIDSETDLVLSPRTGSQMKVAVTTPVPLMIYWLGNNDVLGAMLAFDQYDGSQVTPIPQFTADYETSLQLLKAAGKRFVVATIPSVTHIGFGMDRNALISFAGGDYGLPEGYYTSFPAALLIRLGVAGPELLQNPNWVLDPVEFNKIRQHVLDLNDVIRQKAAAYNVPVVDIYQLFEDMAANPPTYGGVKLNTYINDGVFSLDGVHPSNIGHAVVANAFIQRMNQAFALNIPEFTQAELDQIALDDPFVDLDGDGLVRGRGIFAGLMETLGPALGLSGDEEVAPSIRPKVDAKAFLAEYYRLRGLAPGGNTFDETRKALRYIFGIDSLTRRRSR